MEKIADTQAGDYLALYGTNQVFSDPASFVTLRRSNSDLARFVAIVPEIVAASIAGWDAGWDCDCASTTTATNNNNHGGD